jgi:hypothetical protein
MLAILLALFALVIFEKGPHIFVWTGMDLNFSTYASHVALMTGTAPTPSFFC